MDDDHSLRILFVEDVPADAELAARELRNEGIAFTSTRVETKEAFLQALAEFRPGLIISDYAMPEFDGMTALELSLAHDAKIPFVMLTGSMNEETAVSCMKAGATDYIIKEHMKRIPLAVRGALAQKQIQMEKEDAEKELFAIYENAPLMMLLIDGERRIRKVNGCAETFIGSPVDAIIGLRCGEALRCFRALDVSQGCGFGAHCEECAVRRLVADTLETGRSHYHVEATIPYRSGEQENSMTFLLSSTRLSFRKEPLVLVSLLDITDRKQAEELLQKSEERYRALFIESRDAVMTLSLDQGFLAGNPACVRMFACRDEDDFMNYSLAMLSPEFQPDGRRSEEKVQEMISLAMEKGSHFFEWTHRRQDGTEFPATVLLSRIESIGPRLLQATVRDITESKQTEEILKESENRFRAIFEQAGVGVALVKTKTGEFVKVNQRYCDLVGYTMPEMLQKTFMDITCQEDIQTNVDSNRQLIEAGKGTYSLEKRYRHKDGRLIWGNLTISPLWKPGEKPQTYFHIAIVEDITDRKRAEAELKLRNILLSTQQETSLDGILVVGEKANILSYNQRFLDMWHIPPEVVASSVDAPVLHCVQDQVADPAGFLEKVVYLYAHKGEKSLDDIALKDGRTFNRYSSPMSGLDGTYYGRVWFFHDITEIKQAEKNIVDQKRFLEILLDTIPSPVFYKDLAGKYLGCNMAFEEYLGRQKEDIIGKTAYDLSPREIADKYEKMDRELLETSGKQIYQWKVTPADGPEREVIFTKATFQNSDGETGGLVGIIMDISDLKQTEAQLTETLESLRNAFSTIVMVLVAAVEARDPYTSGHQIRTAEIAGVIATEMGLPQDTIEGIRMAGSIHDIGKLSVPAEILSKPTSLTEIEFALIKEHAQKGFEMLKDVASPWPLAEIVHQHHERMDGSGYPRKLKGEEIIMEARIMAVADVVESMASNRPYRPARGVDTALAEIEKSSGILYDHDVADACLRLFREKGYQLGPNVR